MKRNQWDLKKISYNSCSYFAVLHDLSSMIYQKMSVGILCFALCFGLKGHMFCKSLSKLPEMLLFIQRIQILIQFRTLN